MMRRIGASKATARIALAAALFVNIMSSGIQLSDTFIVGENLRAPTSSSCLFVFE
jgi:hypothetical protein